jgi:site-specific DNA-methyltransferase (adenine-specific)
MQIVEKKLDEIRPYPNNPRNNDGAVDAVAASIRAFGFNVPIIVDASGEIVAGHTRYKAARKLGLETVPVIVADDLTDDQVKALRLADNKVSELSSWDYVMLEDELAEIKMDMEQFGFRSDEEVASISCGGELDLEDFADERFDYCCPECGFMFNE